MTDESKSGGGSGSGSGSHSMSLDATAASKKRKRDEDSDEESEEDESEPAALSALAAQASSSDEDSDEEEDEDDRKSVASPVSVRAESDVDDIGYESDQDDECKHIFNKEVQRWNDSMMFPPGFSHMAPDLSAAFDSLPSTTSKCVDLALINMKRVVDTMRNKGASAPCRLIRDADNKMQWVLKSGGSQWPIKLITSEAAATHALEERVGKIERAVQAVLTKVRKVDFADVKTHQKAETKKRQSSRTSILEALTNDFNWTKDNIEELTPKLFLAKTKMDVSKSTLQRTIKDYKAYILSGEADESDEEEEEDEEDGEAAQPPPAAAAAAPAAAAAAEAPLVKLPATPTAAPPQRTTSSPLPAEL